MIADNSAVAGQRVIEGRNACSQSPQASQPSANPTRGQVVERYVYDAYGRVPFLKADWTLQQVGGGGAGGGSPPPDGTASLYANEILFADCRLNPETGTYQVRHRECHPTLGRWTRRDPLEYVDTRHLYEYVRCNPSLYLDPYGQNSQQAELRIALGGGAYAGLGTSASLTFSTQFEPCCMPDGTPSTLVIETLAGKAHVGVGLGLKADIGVTVIDVMVQGPGLHASFRSESRGECGSPVAGSHSFEAKTEVTLRLSVSVGAPVIGHISVAWSIRDVVKVSGSGPIGGGRGVTEWCGEGEFAVTGRLVVIHAVLYQRPYACDCLPLKEFRW